MTAALIAQSVLIPQTDDDREIAPVGTEQHLTPRELEVLTLLANGRSQKQTARALKIAMRTVRRHIGKAKVKLGARNPVHAVALGVARGFLTVTI